MVSILVNRVNQFAHPRNNRELGFRVMRAMQSKLPNKALCYKFSDSAIETIHDLLEKAANYNTTATSYELAGYQLAVKATEYCMRRNRPAMGELVALLRKTNIGSPLIIRWFKKHTPLFVDFIPKRPLRSTFLRGIWRALFFSFGQKKQTIV